MSKHVVIIHDIKTNERFEKRSFDTQEELGAFLKKPNNYQEDNCYYNLRGANLEGVDLPRVCLTYADLSGANCNGANFEGADLEGANLNDADFTGAHLSGARLYGVTTNGIKGLFNHPEIDRIIFADVPPKVDKEIAELSRSIGLDIMITGNSLKIGDSEMSIEEWLSNDLSEEYRAIFEKHGKKLVALCEGFQEREIEVRTRCGLPLLPETQELDM